MDGRDLGRNKTLSNKNSTQNVHTFDFINLLKAISLKLSGENGMIVFQSIW